MDLEVEVVRVHKKVFRSMYYTDYPDSKDWRDVWPTVWRYRIETDRERIRLRGAERDIETEAFAGRALDDPDGPKFANCLVVADFGTARAARDAEKAVAGKGLNDYRTRYRVGSPEVVRLTIKPHYLQLQFDLGRFPSEFFSSGADYAAAVADVCLRRRGTLHFDDRSS